MATRVKGKVDVPTKDPAPVDAPPDQPIPARPAPRPRTRRGPCASCARRARASGRRGPRPAENVLREGLRLERVPDPCDPRAVRGDRRPRPPQGHPGAVPPLADEPAAARVPASWPSAGAPYDDDDLQRRDPQVARGVQPRPADRRGAWNDVQRADPLPPLRLRPTRRLRRASRTRLDEIDEEHGHARQPAVLPRDPALAVRGDRRPSSGASGSTTSTTTAAGGGSSSRSRSATTSTPPSSSTARSARSSASRRSTASTTTWARRPSATCWSSASATGSSSRSGTAATSTTCRSPWPSRSASRAAARSTRRPARRATSSRTTCSSS